MPYLQYHIFENQPLSFHNRCIIPFYHSNFPVARDHVLTHKFGLPFRIITVHKLVVMSYADGSGGPLALRTSPLASELPLTYEALSFAGGPSGPYLSACGGQLLNVRCAHYAGGASLSTFGFVTIVPRYLLPQVIPSHSFAALTALIVRRVNDYENQPSLACVSRRTLPKGHWRAHPAAAPCRPLNIPPIMQKLQFSYSLLWLM